MLDVCFVLNSCANLNRNITKRSLRIGGLVLKWVHKICAYHLASEPVAPLFASAASVHCSQHSDHSYLSAHNNPTHKRNVIDTTIYAHILDNARYQNCADQKQTYARTNYIQQTCKSRKLTHSLGSMCWADAIYLQEGQLSGQGSCFCLQCLYFPFKLSNVSHLPFLWSSSWLPVCPDPIMWNKKEISAWF